MIVRNKQAVFFKVRMLFPCFTAYIKDLPYVVLPLLQQRQHYIFLQIFDSYRKMPRQMD